MEQTLKIINKMKNDGIIKNYAIGGAVAAMFYIDAFATEDLDIFFAFTGTPESPLDILSPIYRYLENLGYYPEGVMIKIGEWPVQFLPLSNPLVEEAVAQANETEFRETPVRVISAEHLVAIMLDTGRSKDYSRIARFLEMDAVDMELLIEILSHYNLVEKWHEKKERFTP